MQGFNHKVWKGTVIEWWNCRCIGDNGELQAHADGSAEFEIKVRNEIRVIDKFISKKSESAETLITDSTAAS